MGINHQKMIDKLTLSVLDQLFKAINQQQKI
jgi:hypothetical protein